MFSRNDNHFQIRNPVLSGIFKKEEEKDGNHAVNIIISTIPAQNFEGLGEWAGEVGNFRIRIQNKSSPWEV